jgi:hypothetical protein
MMNLGFISIEEQLVYLRHYRIPAYVIQDTKENRLSIERAKPNNCPRSCAYYQAKEIEYKGLNVIDMRFL